MRLGTSSPRQKNQTRVTSYDMQQDRSLCTASRGLAGVIPEWGATSISDTRCRAIAAAARRGAARAAAGVRGLCSCAARVCTGHPTTQQHAEALRHMLPAHRCGCCVRMRASASVSWGQPTSLSHLVLAQLLHAPPLCVSSHMPLRWLLPCVLVRPHPTHARTRTAAVPAGARGGSRRRAHAPGALCRGAAARVPCGASRRPGKW
jgi:hypothetical protein